MRSRQWLVAFAAAALLLPSPLGAAQTPPPAAQSSDDGSIPIEATVARVATQGMAAHIPGGVIVVSDRGTVTTKAFGYSDLSKRDAVTLATRFEIGSITKQFTAACILQLVERKALTLDDPLSKYVPSYHVASAVTVRQLLGQLSGIPEYLHGKNVVADAGKVTTFDALLARVSARPLEFVPGTKWRYSNTNYILLGHIVELVSHQSYESYVREHIFIPAHLTHTGFTGDELQPQATQGYTLDKRRTPLPAPPLDETWAGAAGAIVSTGGDVLAWDEALLSGTIISPSDVVLMRTSGRLTNGSQTGYGFGWIVDSVESHPRIWHNGRTFGYTAANITYPRDDQIVIVLVNLANADTETITRQIFGSLHSDVSRALSVSAPGEDPKITARVREWLHRFETGDVDRSRLTAEMSAALTPDIIDSAKEQLSPLGDPKMLLYHGKSSVGSDTVYAYIATFAAGTFKVTMTVAADGKIGGYFLRRE